MAEPNLRKLIIAVRSGLWARPLILTAAALVLGLGLPAVDRLLVSQGLPQNHEALQLLLQTSPDGSRAVLTASVSALATILAVGFSMMMLTVQLASSQYTARLLRTFMADRTTQWVLGAFIGTIVYLLLVLRSIRAEDQGHPAFVPLGAIALAMVLTILCLSLLAYFLHHTTRSVDASSIIATVGKQTLRQLNAMSFDRATVDDLDLEPRVLPGQLLNRHTGYLQIIDEERVVRALPRGTRLARLEVRTGDFVVPGNPVVSFWPSAPVTSRMKRHIEQALAVGSERTLEQDALYGVRKLVDVALKALSPAVNDVTTALMVVNELGAIICMVAARQTPGEGWRVRRIRGVTLLVDAFGLQPVLEEAYGELPRTAREHPRVLARMLETLSQAARLVKDAATLEVIYRTGSQIVDAVDGTAILPHERAVVDERWLDLQAGLKHTPSEPHRPEPVH